MSDDLDLAQRVFYDAKRAGRDVRISAHEGSEYVGRVDRYEIDPGPNVDWLKVTIKVPIPRDRS